MESTSNDRLLMSAGEVARRFAISVSRVAGLVESGELVCVAKTKGGRVFDRDHVEEVAARRAEAARHDYRVTPPASVGSGGGSRD